MRYAPAIALALVIIAFAKNYERWLGPENDPHDLMITYPSEPMTMWPISTRVNSPDNDDPSLLDRITGLSDVWAPLEPEATSRKRLG